MEVFEAQPEPKVVPLPEKKQILLYVATPAFGCLVSNQYLQSVMNLQLECLKRGIGIVFDIIGNESLVQRGRCILTERFAKSDATHMLFIDADIGFHPESLFRLLKFDKDVTSCVYPKKFINWPSLEAKLKAGDKEPLHQMGLDFNINIKGDNAQVVDGFVNVLDTATGFLLIKKEVILKMKENYKDSLYAVNDIISEMKVPDYIALFDCMIDPDTRRYLSEDYAFARRWQQMGGDIWVDVASPLSHTGNMFFNGDIMQRVAVSTA
jgi:hypothetical protein